MKDCYEKLMVTISHDLLIEYLKLAAGEGLINNPILDNILNNEILANALDITIEKD
jgi:hypothetical protein